MKNSGAILLHFNRTLITWNLFVGLACIYYIDKNEITTGNAYFFKAISYLVVVGFQHYNYSIKKTFFYFRNAGYSIRGLYVYSFLIDIALFSIMVTSYHLIKSK